MGQQITFVQATGEPRTVHRYLVQLFHCHCFNRKKIQNIFPTLTHWPKNPGKNVFHLKGVCELFFFRLTAIWENYSDEIDENIKTIE